MTGTNGVFLLTSFPCLRLRLLIVATVEDLKWGAKANACISGFSTIEKSGGPV